MEAKRSSNIRRLAIKIDSTILDQESISIIETPETFLTVSWMSITNAFNRMYRLRSLELLLPFFLSRRTVASICEALSGSPICSIHSRVDIREAFKEYGVWGSSITDLVLQGVEVFPELPHLPNLRFIACNNIDVITGLIPSSPLESICSNWGYSSESALTRLMTTISRQAGTGLSALRNIYVKQYLHPNTVLWGFLGSLECPTLEHIHLVLSGSEWFEPHSMIDHVPICLDAAPLSISQRLPALRSLRLELYDSNLFTVPPELKRSEIPSSTLETEAASRLSLWLHQNYYPPLLKHIQIYEAKRPVTLPGGLTKSSDPDFWEVTDSVENIFLPEPWSIYSSGFYPPFVVSDPTALPLVPNPDGVIRMVAQVALLPEILTDILYCLSTPDLMNCAVVNQSWGVEATRILWYSIKFQVSILSPQDLEPAIEKFTRFVNTLTLSAQRSSNVRRLSIEINGSIFTQPELTIIETPKTFLTVSWDSIAAALNRMHRLRHLDLQLPFFLSSRFVSSLCEALSGVPICTMRSRVYIERTFKEYAAWASSLTELVLQGVEDFPEIPHLPQLRLLACDYVDVISHFSLSSPLQSICFFGGYATESGLMGLLNAIYARTSAGSSTLRSIYIRQFMYSKMLLWNFLSLLKCPTLEHIHLVLGALDWFEPCNMTEYVTLCLDARGSSMPQALPALRSMRLELYDTEFHAVPTKLRQPDPPLSPLETRAGSHLSKWLNQNTHPPLLHGVQIYSMGCSNGPLAGCRVVSIEASQATQPLTLISEPTEKSSSDPWEVIDSVDNVFLPESWTVTAHGCDRPSLVFHSTALPIVPDPDGTIRWSSPPTYTLCNLDGRSFPMSKGHVPDFLA
ncbi:hypothetical protein DL93DRAFT_2233058 [Clavulina sp. PMI_390]|nr:hypothetical protein DL93DRAFT_2233058 [Clavulina sp. PMI_390]